jgi:chromosome segregation protein
MRISFVELSGFRGFRDKTRIEFSSGFVVLTGRNGAGKSTVLDAIDFALTGTIGKFAGKHAKGGGLESHIWWVGDGIASDCYVKVGFSSEQDREVVVTRSRDKGVEPTIEMLASTLCKGRVADDWATTLMQTTLIRDETLAGLSLDLPEQARFEAVRAAIGGLTGPDHSARTSLLHTASKAAKIAQDYRVAQIQEELGRALSLLTEARSIADRQPDISIAEQTIARLDPDLANVAPSGRAEQLRNVVAERKQAAQTIVELIDRAEELSSEAIYFASDVGRNAFDAAQKMDALSEAELEAAKRTFDTAASAVAAEQSSDRFASQMIALLAHGEDIGLIEGHCPLCDAARSDVEFAGAIEAARARLSSRGDAAARAQSRLEEARLTLDKRTHDFENAKRQLAVLANRKTRIIQEMAKIDETLAQYKLSADTSDIKAVRASSLRYQEDTAELEHALFLLEASTVYDRVSALEVRIDELRSLVDTETYKATAADRAVENAKQIDNAARSVANQILTEQFDTVMPLLKELYQRLRPHTDWREIETDFGGKVRASLNFTVGDGRNPQFLFSSGQRRAAGLAFLLAIHLSRPWSNLQTLLLDDPVQHIDDYRALNLVEVLSGIRRLGRQVVVAVEDPALADLLCRRLRGSATDQGRRYDLSVNASGSARIELESALSPLPTRVLELSEAS